MGEKAFEVEAKGSRRRMTGWGVGGGEKQQRARITDGRDDNLGDDEVMVRGCL